MEVQRNFIIRWHYNWLHRKTCFWQDVKFFFIKKKNLPANPLLHLLKLQRTFKCLLSTWYTFSVCWCHPRPRGAAAPCKELMITIKRPTCDDKGVHAMSWSNTENYPLLISVEILPPHSYNISVCPVSWPLLPWKPLRCWMHSYLCNMAGQMAQRLRVSNGCGRGAYQLWACAWITIAYTSSREIWHINIHTPPPHSACSHTIFLKKK